MIAEFDARGEIDSHAAMCLRFTIEDLLSHGASEIVIDLRDLTAIDQRGLALLHEARRSAADAGVPLSLLIGDDSAGEALARVVQHAGLRVQPAPETWPQPRARPRSARNAAGIHRPGAGSR